MNAAGERIHISEEDKSGKREIYYTYDNAGNRLSKTENGIKTGYTYNSINQLTEEKSGEKTISYRYDADGNLISKSGDGVSESYGYDDRDRLTEYTDGKTVETYTYDAEGARRSKKTEDKTADVSNTVIFINDYTGSISQTVAETDGQGGFKALYVRADGPVGQIREGHISYYMTDGHGDVRALTDEEGNVTDTYSYTAYGELKTKTGNTENPYLYTGEYCDEASGLYYLRARYMNPSTGRFISMDSYGGNVYDPASLHRYTYANDNPVMYNDPSGYFAVPAVIAAGINEVLSHTVELNYLAIMNSVMNAAAVSLMGGTGDEILKAPSLGFER